MSVAQSLPNPPRTISTTGSPVKRSLKGVSKYSTKLILYPERRETHDSEMSSHWIGGMPPRDFLDTFMPLPPKRTFRSIKKNHFDALPKGGLETKMYPEFVRLYILHLLSLIFNIFLGQTCSKRISRKQRQKT